MAAIKPRPYQLEAVQAVVDAYRRGITRQLLSLPTGSGKTVIFSMLARHVQRKTLVIAHRDELLEQAYQKLRAVYPEARIGIVKGRTQELWADVVVCGVQTAAKRLEALKQYRFDLMVIDEAHHSAANSYRKVISGLGFADDRAKLLVGVTATAYRADRRGLGEIFQKITYERTILSMIREGYLCDARGVSVKTQFDISNVRTEHGDFKVNDLALAIDLPERNELVVDSYKEQTPGARGVCFCANVEHAQHMADAFSAAGVPAAAIWGSMGMEARKRTLRAFADGRYQVLTNCAVLTEGFDEPSISAVVLARPTKSRSLYVQMVGRGLRIHPGKRECIVLDFGDNCGRHDLCNLGSLLSDDDHLRKARDGETVKETAERIEREEDEALRGQIQITDVSMQVVSLFKADPHNWLPSGKDYVLEAGAMRLMALWQGEGAYTLKMVRGRAEEILVSKPAPLAEVLAAAERVVTALPSASRIARKDSAWRYDPATAGQRRKMDQLKIQYSDDVTSGQASAMITQKEVEIERKKKEPATDAQLRYLRALGITAPEHCTKVMAGYLIGRGRSGAGRYAG